jgi:hypothetical protein
MPLTSILALFILVVTSTVLSTPTLPASPNYLLYYTTYSGLDCTGGVNKNGLLDEYNEYPRVFNPGRNERRCLTPFYNSMLENSATISRYAIDLYSCDDSYLYYRQGHDCTGQAVRVFQVGKCANSKDDTGYYWDTTSYKVWCEPFTAIGILATYSGGSGCNDVPYQTYLSYRQIGIGKCTSGFIYKTYRGLNIFTLLTYTDKRCLFGFVSAVNYTLGSCVAPNNLYPDRIVFTTANTASPSTSPSHHPTTKPTTGSPSRAPSAHPTMSPSTSQPSVTPTTSSPSRIPSISPSLTPTISEPTTTPSKTPSAAPSTSKPSKTPTTSIPSQKPSISPSLHNQIVGLSSSALSISMFRSTYIVLVVGMGVGFVF